MIDGGDFVVKNVPVGFVEGDTFLDDALVVRMERNASAGSAAELYPLPVCPEGARRVGARPGSENGG
jgi:hypothetical protein